jgi:hypothetical protein
MHMLRRRARAACALLPLLWIAAAARAGSALEPGAPLLLERIASGVPGVVYAAAPPGDERLFLVNRFGVVVVLGPGGSTPFLDLMDRVDAEGEGGLLSLAFSPDYATTGFFYVYYTTDTDGDPETPSDLTARVSRFQAIGDPATATAADPASEQILLAVVKPTPEHNAGTVAMRDGWLYVAIGDGGGIGDPFDLAQDPTVPYGKMLRFDPSQPVLAIDAWARGFRNPFRFSFDRETGDLYVGDVGLDAWEEVNVEPASEVGGRNYGWDVKEGPGCFDDSMDEVPGPDPSEPLCSDPNLVDPVFAYAHDDPEAFCFSVTGGAVYRGAALPGLAGRYFFSDFCSGWVRSFVWDGAGGTIGPVREHPLLIDAGTLDATAAVIEDGAGELVFVDYDGELFRLVPEPGATGLGVAAAFALAAIRRGRSARRD